MNGSCVLRCCCHTRYAGDDFVVVTGSRHYRCWRWWIAIVWYGRRCGGRIATSNTNKNIQYNNGIRKERKILYKKVIGVGTEIFKQSVPSPTLYEWNQLDWKDVFWNWFMFVQYRLNVGLGKPQKFSRKLVWSPHTVFNIN